jgi:hypothetical protein
MSIPAGIDGNAPVRARQRIDIHASLDTVWRLHTDVNDWPAWQTDITAAHLEGPFQPGASFEWTSYGLAVVSTIYAVANHARVLWGGPAGGITGIHEWLFAQTPAGVHVTTQESFAGQPVEAGIARVQAILDTSLAAWLRNLKSAAEDRV